MDVETVNKEVFSIVDFQRSVREKLEPEEKNLMVDQLIDYILDRKDQSKNKPIPIASEYFKREIEKAKKDAYADALYQYRHNKLIDYIDYLEKISEV